jgi:hypothetical protein
MSINPTENTNSVVTADTNAMVIKSTIVVIAIRSLIIPVKEFIVVISEIDLFFCFPFVGFFV